MPKDLFPGCERASAQRKELSQKLTDLACAEPGNGLVLAWIEALRFNRLTIQMVERIRAKHAALLNEGGEK